MDRHPWEESRHGGEGMGKAGLGPLCWGPRVTGLGRLRSGSSGCWAHLGHAAREGARGQDSQGQLLGKLGDLEVLR